MYSLVNYITSEINVPQADIPTGNINAINQNNTLTVKTRPHIVATRAARQARRASRSGL